MVLQYLKRSTQVLFTVSLLTKMVDLLLLDVMTVVWQCCKCLKVSVPQLKMTRYLMSKKKLKTGIWLALRTHSLGSNKIFFYTILISAAQGIASNFNLKANA